MAGRLWFYANYHCNLTCSYCLTESGPGVPRRQLSADLMLNLAGQAAALGFDSLGVTGGEPFLVKGLPALLREMSLHLPVLVLSNGTAFSPRVLRELAVLRGSDVGIQLSLDSAEPDVNDEFRGDGNHAAVLAAIPMLRELGLRVRIATTSNSLGPKQLARLCELHRSLGVPDEDHVVRPIISRGRAAVSNVGVAASVADLPPELTITADGAFWSPFGPTIRSGRLDTDLLLTRTTSPLKVPWEALTLVAGGPLPAPDPTLRIT